MRFAYPFQPGVALHLVQRDPDRAPCFASALERLAYLAILRDAAARFRCAVHAYVLMGNHAHVLLTPWREQSATLLMRSLGEGGASPLAGARPCAGTAWREHFEATPLYVRRHLLASMRYIELNPGRAGIVARPGDFRWSSYRANALGLEDPLVTPHALYCALGRSPELRRAAYRSSFPRAKLR